MRNHCMFSYGNKMTFSQELSQNLSLHGAINTPIFVLTIALYSMNIGLWCNIYPTLSKRSWWLHNVGYMLYQQHVFPVY